MDLGRYSTTIMLVIIFSYTESEQVKVGQILQNTCKKVNLLGEHTNYRQLFTNAPFVRDVTKWKLSRLVPIKSKVIERIFFTSTPNTISYKRESKEVSRTCKDSSRIKLTSKNSLIDFKYWNILQDHHNIEEFSQFIRTNKNKSNKLDNKNAMPEKKSQWGGSQNSSIDSTVTIGTIIAFDPQPVKRKSNIDFYYWDNVDGDLKIMSRKSPDLNPFEEHVNCSGNKITKVLFANIPITLQDERLPFVSVNSKPPLKDTFLDFAYWQTDELKEISTGSPVTSQVSDRTPKNIYTILALSSTSLCNLQKPTKVLDLVQKTDNYTTNKTENDIDSDYSNDVAQETINKTILARSPFSLNSKASPEMLTTIILNDKDPSNLGVRNNYLNRLEQDIEHNKTKFNKRSLENFKTVEVSSYLHTTLEIKSTAYDKINFFEIYDAHTYENNKVSNIKNESNEQLLALPLKHGNISRYRKSNLDENYIKAEKYELDVTPVSSTAFREPDNKNLDDVFVPTLPTIAYPSINTKKENFANQTESISMTMTMKVTLSDAKKNLNHMTKKPPTNLGNRYSKKSFSARNIFKISTKKHKPKSQLLLHKSFKTSWTTYPFVAAYIHEPLQIHCDAASISAHWLIAAAACMSRMYAINNDPLEGRSAYVSYCSNDWWRPELIGYVKYSVVHPQFNPRHQVKRRLYNIGLIRVANSMSANCPVWRPVSLSHQIMTKLEGVEGVAVGWGLDRITQSQFNGMETTWKPLSMFTGLVFTNVCPGNHKFGKPKTANEEKAIQNVYCLSLPPYSGETRDPTHGSILLIRNKLVGLYLQEERRLFGTQSAQYTSIWKLLPWIFENAKEPENADNFSFDIL